MENKSHRLIAVDYEMYVDDDGQLELKEVTSAGRPFRFVSGLGYTLDALENALHANLKLPVEQRVIYCRAVGSPSLMFELSNPCCEPVVFDGQGLPVAQSQGHGLGVQSIAAFCKKNGAVCRFELADGTFLLQLVL